jgi:hypothetical protein
MPTTCPKCFATFRGRTVSFHITVCPAGLTPEDLFWQKVDRRGADECWLWTGALQRDGYAHFTMRRKTISSHRYAYERLVGPIAEGMDLLHSCDVRHCVNPGHLRPGTHSENMAECYEKRRHVHGVRSVHAKLTEEQVREIRASYKGKWGEIIRLARKLGIHEGTVRSIVRGHTWRFVK